MDFGKAIDAMMAMIREDLAALGVKHDVFFSERSLTGATDGNLGAHLDQLARAGYVEATKAFVARRPRTTVKATARGRAAFARHVAFLKAIIAET